MILNAAALRSAAKGFKVVFLNGFNNAKPIYTRLTGTPVRSTGSMVEYLMSGGLPGLRKWTGDRQIRNLKVHDWVVKNENFELTVAVDRNLYEDDTLGVIEPEFRAMGAAARLHPDKLVCDLLNDGFTEKCYDGKAFFATDHPMQSGTQSNKTQKKLSAAEFEIGVAALRKMKNFQGELQSALSLGGKLALIVPPALESTADAIVTAAVKTGGATNTNFGKAEKIVWDRLTSETAWFLAVVDGPVSPLIYQVRKDPELVMLANPDDESVFTRREIVHGVDGRWAATYGPFQLCYGSDGTVA